MSFSWEKIHFDKRLRGPKTPWREVKTLLIFSQVSLMPSARTPCSCQTWGSPPVCPVLCPLTREPSFKAGWRPASPSHPTDALYPFSGSPHHMTVTRPPDVMRYTDSPKGMTGKFLRWDPPPLADAPLAHAGAGSWGEGAGCWAGRVPHRWQRLDFEGRASVQEKEPKPWASYPGWESYGITQHSTWKGRKASGTFVGALPALNLCVSTVFTPAAPVALFPLFMKWDE